MFEWLKRIITPTPLEVGQMWLMPETDPFSSRWVAKIIDIKKLRRVTWIKDDSIPTRHDFQRIKLPGGKVAPSVPRTCTEREFRTYYKERLD